MPRTGETRRRDQCRRRYPAGSSRADPGESEPVVLGVIQLKDIVKQGMAERFDELRRMGIRTLTITETIR